MFARVFAGFSLVMFVACADGIPAPPVVQAESIRAPLQQNWKVDGAERTALVVPPAIPTTSARSPIVFIFHGHGGTSAHARRSYDAEKHWPEATFVYPQGLPTRGALTDSEGKRTGWQPTTGMYDDRDLKFFDAMLASLVADAHGDANRVYVSGHSNGGGFTYLLWAQRGDRLAAVAPSSAFARAGVARKPLPAMHIAQRNDPLVAFDRQERTMIEMRKVNGCDSEASKVGTNGSLYPSPTGTPVLLWISDGTHKFNSASVPTMVDFFRAHSRSPG